MNRELVREPGVSAFLQLACQNLDHISLMEPSNTAPIYYEPRQDLKKLKEKLASFQDLLADGEAESVDEIKLLLCDLEDILDDIRGLSNDQVRVYELYVTSDELKERLGEIWVRTDVLLVRAKDLELKRGSGYALWGNYQPVRRRPDSSAIVEMSEIYGRVDDKKVMVKRLLVAKDRAKLKNCDVICIVGMGGLGKITLAQLVFNDPEVEKHFVVKRWVCIWDVFYVGRATKELIGYSGGDGSSGKQQSLAGLQGHVYQLLELNHEKCMTIFRDMAFGDDEGEYQKLNLGEKIVRACIRVPLVVKVIGSMLQGAEEDKWRAVSEKAALWDAAYRKIDEIHPAIRLGNHCLPAFLKRCFEYLAISPPDFRFNKEIVVRLWIAVDLVEEVDGRIVEDIGNEYYNDLRTRISLIQENDRMHDIVHHLASVVSRKFCYKENSKEPPSSVRHAFLTNLNAMNNKFLDQAPWLCTLIVIELEDENVLVSTIRSCKMPRTLRIDPYKANNWTLSLAESSIDHLTHLLYLNIKGSGIRRLPDSLFMLGNLQFFDLGENKHLESLPEKMNQLSNLRCLQLRQSSILRLPDSICTLCPLQILDLPDRSHLKQLPKDIGNLRSLRTLDLIRSSILGVPESILNVTGLQNLLVDEPKQFPLHIGRLSELKKMPVYHLGVRRRDDACVSSIS